MATIAEQIRQMNVQLLEKSEAFNKSLPKFVKGPCEANVNRHGELEICCDGPLTGDTTEKFVQWILNNFVRNREFNFDEANN